MPLAIRSVVTIVTYRHKKKQKPTPAILIPRSLSNYPSCSCGLCYPSSRSESYNVLYASHPKMDWCWSTFCNIVVISI